MSPPPIRYPLPTLVLAAALALIAWRGAAWTASWRAALAARWARVVAGPPVPSSTTPMVVAGPIVRRVLLLAEPTPATARPGGPVVTSIDRRIFADVYDLWPLSGPPTHYRIGNRRPIGWVAAEAVLPWDTRLVVRAPAGGLPLDGEGRSPARSTSAVLPVVGWSDRAVELADWAPEAPWSAVGRRGWVPLEAVPDDAWGAWLSRVELLALLRRALAGQGDGVPRVAAILGPRDRAYAPRDVAAARAALPAPVARIAGPTPTAAAERLARLNEQWAPDASWSGLSFRAVPLGDLP